MKLPGVVLIIAVVASILFVVACGGGKDGDAPAAVKGIASTNTPEPTSTPDPVSSQSPTPPPYRWFWKRFQLNFSLVFKRLWGMSNTTPLLVAAKMQLPNS